MFTSFLPRRTVFDRFPRNYDRNSIIVYIYFSRNSNRSSVRTSTFCTRNQIQSSDWSIANNTSAVLFKYLILRLTTLHSTLVEETVNKTTKILCTTFEIISPIPTKTKNLFHYLYKHTFDRLSLTRVEFKVSEFKKSFVQS